MYVPPDIIEWKPIDWKAIEESIVPISSPPKPRPPPITGNTWSCYVCGGGYQSKSDEFRIEGARYFITIHHYCRSMVRPKTVRKFR